MNHAKSTNIGENRLTKDLTPIQQHSATKSILLHLLPGIPILIGLVLFSNPFFSNLLGIAVELKLLVGLSLTILFILAPVQLGILLYEGKKLNGKLSLKGVIKYTTKNTLKDYLIYVPIIFVFSVAAFAIVSPAINPIIIDTFFSWFPPGYNLQNIIDPANFEVIAGYSGVYLLLTIFIIANGFIGPFVEELYFRGYLLPRMGDYAEKWAPVYNVVLFSVYHFFSPWENLTRIIGLIPMVYVVWWKKDIRFSMLVHILLNTTSGIMILAAIL